MCRETHLRLEAGKQIHQERVPHRVGHLEDALLAQQRLDLVPRNNVALLKRLNGKVLPRIFVLRQNDLAKVAPTKHAQQPEAVDLHSCSTSSASHLRLAPTLVRTVPILEGTGGALTSRRSRRTGHGQIRLRVKGSLLLLLELELLLVVLLLLLEGGCRCRRGRGHAL